MKIYLSHCVLVIPEYYLTQALSICVNMLSAAMLRCYTESYHAESHILAIMLSAIILCAIIPNAIIMIFAVFNVSMLIFNPPS